MAVAREQAMDSCVENDCEFISFDTTCMRLPVLFVSLRNVMDRSVGEPCNYVTAGVIQ